MRQFHILALAAAAVLALVPLRSQATPATGGAVMETTAQIMARSQGRGAATSAMRRMLPIGRMPETELPIRPADSIDSVQWPPAGNTPVNYGVTPKAAQTGSLSFTGATLADTRSFPPDTMGAVGPSQFTVACNGRIRTFDKTTGLADGVLNADMDVFFASVKSTQTSTFTSDPRVRYDRLSGRWFVTIIDVPGGTGAGPNRVLLAVSSTAVLAAGTVWSFFYFQQDQVSPTGDTGLFADYPTLGIDANALYIGVNMFSQRTFVNTTAFVVRKSSMLGAGPIHVTAFRGLIPKGNSGGPYTPQGVDNYDPAATEGYFIAANSRSYGNLILLRVSNPGGAPTISGNIALSTPANTAPITVPHLDNTGGTNGYLDGLDHRLLAAHLRNGRLWTALNTGVDNNGTTATTATRDGVRWYELQGVATGSTFSLVQSGIVFQPSAANTTDQRSYWMGTVMVSGQGHVALGCSVAGSQEHINAAFTGRLASDPLGTMQTPVLYTNSTTGYNPTYDTGGASGRRWGDYSFTSLDPDDDMTMWTIQEFCDATNSYGVRAIKLLAPKPATPVSCSPATLAAGASGVNVTVTGAQVGGSGFFDPGPGFAKRLAAAVSGTGVTVNNVTYISPTQIALNLTVDPGAVSGARLVAVTNPDGQSMVSATGILTITARSGNLPPTATVALVPLAPRTTDILTANATATDPNGDAVTLSYIWKRNGNTVKTTTGTSSLFDTLDLSVAGNGDRGDVITVQVTPFDGQASGATVSASVTVVDTAPVVLPVSGTVPHRSTAGVDIALSGSDADGDALVYSVVTPPASGTAIISGATVHYTPLGDQVGVITFTVKASDGTLDSAPATVSVTLTNTAPVVTVSLDNAAPRTADVLTATATPVDADGDPVTLTYVWKRNGTVVKTTAGVSALTDTLDLGVSGNGDRGDTITIEVTPNDGHTNGITASASATVVNSPPTAVADSFTVAEDTVATLHPTANDTDPDGDALTISAVGTPSHGVATVSADALSVIYAPAPDYTGSDAFTYTIDDGHGGNATATVTISVTPVNEPPVLVNDSVSALEDTPLIIASASLTANDAPGPPNESGQSLFVTAVDSVTTGGGSAVLNGDATITYTPPLHFAGTDSFRITVTDNGITGTLPDPKSARSTVTVTVARVASRLVFLTAPGGAVAGAPLNPQPVVAVQDAGGVTVPGYSGSVTVSLKTGAGSAGAALTGTASVAVVNGTAAFTDLSVDLAGAGYVLDAASAGLGGADSTAFNVSQPPYTVADAIRALGLAGGIELGGPRDAARLGAPVTLETAVSIARKVAGLDANP
ncbi:MAG TPA: Ig-like domain-containing protein [Armatimonadota bacterium]|jgi:hypothetical protein